MIKSIHCKTRIKNNRQKSITLSIIAGLFFCISNTLGQNTTIVFKTKENSKIAISKEIDNAHTSILTDEIKTDAAGNYVYSWDVNDFQFIQCSFYDGGETYFPIKEGGHLTITYKGDHQFEFAGADKAEVEYYRHQRLEQIVHPYLDSLFNFPTEAGIEDFLSFIEKYNSLFSNTLDSLVTENRISLKFSDILKNEFVMFIACTGIDACKTKYLEQSPTKANQFINETLDKIFPMIDSGDILKYSLGRSAVNIYYANKYEHWDEKDKEKLLSRNAWANQLSPNKLGYLIAPQEIQYKLLSLELLDNYENAVTREDSTFIKHISEIRPQNAFLPYIEEKRNALLQSMDTDISGVKYIENTINALEDLSKVDDLNQKVLHIDMWATWCGPCIGEFKHRDKIHKLLVNYKNIIPVYISMDDDSNDTVWKEKTKAFNLNGYHLRANKELVTDISKKLFDGGVIGLPRYILLDKEGNILEKNLSRPSNIDKLKQELDKHFE